MIFSILHSHASGISFQASGISIRVSRTFFGIRAGFGFISCFGVSPLDQILIFSTLFRDSGFEFFQDSGFGFRFLRFRFSVLGFWVSVQG